MTRAEEALFTALGYGQTLPPADLPMRAVMEFYSPDGSKVTEGDCRSALTDALAKGWVQVLDAESGVGSNAVMCPAFDAAT